MFLAKERLCSRILLDVNFAVFLWPGINKINVDRLLVMTSGTINIHGNRQISFYVAQTVVELLIQRVIQKSIKSLDATASAAGG